ncbi:cell division ATPase MinD [Candidatus Micrarchaeota archaeon]|nr:cell division ATPase MinD [Candidatus Micrarchaeota archaeon]
MRSIVLASGKGGVGKTSIAINLGLILSQQGKRVVVVDADVSMANVGIMLGIERAPISLHNVLMGETNIRDSVYEGPFKLKYVPSSLSVERVNKLVFDRLKSAIEDLEPIADFVLIDSPPGLNKDSEYAIMAAREILLVVTPDPASLADALKVINFAGRNNISISGIVVNMSLGDKGEIKSSDLETLLSARVLVVIPEDVEMRKSTIAQSPLIVRKPSAKSAQAIRVLAARLTGDPVSEAPRVKKGFLQRILDSIGGIFRKKK